MTETAIKGIHHVTLSVSDLDRTVEWYSRVLGFDLVRRLTHGGLEKAMVRRDGVLVTFVCHGDLAVQGPFNERQTGLDHLSFAVADRATLEAWVARLDEHDVVHSDIVEGATGNLVPFRDPDNIALEFYTVPA
jgi:catechol 2,3-dioxygenase-like lactoylglutathione lyase family enzyme